MARSTKNLSLSTWAQIQGHQKWGTGFKFGSRKLSWFGRWLEHQRSSVRTRRWAHQAWPLGAPTRPLGQKSKFQQMARSNQYFSRPSLVQSSSNLIWGTRLSFGSVKLCSNEKWLGQDEYSVKCLAKSHMLKPNPISNLLDVFYLCKTVWNQWQTMLNHPDLFQASKICFGQLCASHIFEDIMKIMARFGSPNLSKPSRFD